MPYRFARALSILLYFIVALCNIFIFRAGRLDPILIRHRFRKVPVFTVHTETRKRRFQALWRAFLESCVFGDRFNRIRVDGRRIRKEKVAVSNENGYVWTGAKSVCERMQVAQAFQTFAKINSCTLS